MALERELEVYLSKLPELKAENEGKFVLIDPWGPGDRHLPQLRGRNQGGL